MDMRIVHVYCIYGTNKTNIALSKMKFATAVLEGQSPFNQMNFSNFISLFEIIRDILQEKTQEGNPLGCLFFLGEYSYVKRLSEIRFRL